MEIESTVILSSNQNNAHRVWLSADSYVSGNNIGIIISSLPVRLVVDRKLIPRELRYCPVRRNFVLMLCHFSKHIVVDSSFVFLYPVRRGRRCVAGVALTGAGPERHGGTVLIIRRIRVAGVA